MILTRKKTIFDKVYSINKINIQRLELREYKILENKVEEKFVLMIRLKTDNQIIELDFLGKPTNDRERFDESFNYLCNYNGLSSTLNRLLIEMDIDTIKD